MDTESKTAEKTMGEVASTRSPSGINIDIEAAPSMTSNDLKRALQGRHMQMLAIGGSIGAGFFVGSGGALTLGGPASLLLGFGITGLMVLGTIQVLGELTVMYPVNGAFYIYIVHFIDPAWGFTVGWLYAIGWLLTVPFEIIAIGLTINYWHEYNIGIWVAVFLTSIAAVQFFGVRGYGEVEFVLGVIKLVAVAGFIIFGIIVNCGLPADTRGYIGFRYWDGTDENHAFRNGFAGFCSVFVLAAFAYGGSELVGFAAAEAQDPRKSLPKATKQVLWHILGVYVLSSLIVGIIVPNNSPDLLYATGANTKASPFVLAIQYAGVRGLPSVFNAVITVSTLSVANSATYGSTRTLQALAQHRMAPRFLAYVNGKGRPIGPDHMLHVTALLSTTLQFEQGCPGQYQYGRETSPQTISERLPGADIATPSIQTETHCIGILCVELGFECVYQQPTAGNVRASQGPSGYDERLRAIEDTLQLLVHQRSQPQSSSREEGPSHDLKMPPNGEWSKNSQAAAIDRPLPDDEEVAILDEDHPLQQNGGEDSVDGMAAITDPQETESRFFGPSSNIAFLRHISDATSVSLKAIGPSRHLGNAINQPIVSRAVSPVTTLSDSPPMTRQAVNIRSLPSESRALHLIRLFFSDTGMLFPYIHEQEILRTYSAARKNRFAAVSRSWLCLLNGIFAFATYISARPDQSVWKNAAESEIFMERAQALSADIELKSANLETVQCLLLMAQYRQAIQLGLHSPSASVGLSAIETEIRKRTWFGCMMMDRILSMTFGRPPTIPNDYMKLDLPLNQNLDKLTVLGSTAASVGTLDPPDTVCFFIATIQLYYIIGDVLTQLYGSNVDIDPHLTLPTMLERTMVLEQRLAAWKRNLYPQLQRRPWDTLDPETISMSAWDPVFDRLSVIITLRYLNARILLHRPLLSAFLQQRARFRAAAEVTEDGDPFFQDLAARSVKICEQSAMEMVEIVHKTSNPPALLGAWWFSAYYTFNSALVIFSCILLAITTSNGWSHNGPTITMTGSLDTHHIVEMVTELCKAAEALQRFGEGTRSAKRTRKTVLKLIQICVTLAQCHADHGPSILAALAASHHLQQQQQQQQIQQRQHHQYQHTSEVGAPMRNSENGLDVPVHDANDNPVIANVPVDGALPHVASHSEDPFTMFDLATAVSEDKRPRLFIYIYKQPGLSPQDGAALHFGAALTTEGTTPGLLDYWQMSSSMSVHSPGLNNGCGELGLAQHPSRSFPDVLNIAALHMPHHGICPSSEKDTSNVILWDVARLYQKGEWYQSGCPKPQKETDVAGPYPSKQRETIVTMKLPWTRLIRFVATDGRVLRGEPILPSADFDLGKVTEADGLKAKVIVGDDPFDTTGKTVVSDEVATVKKLLGPLAREDVPILRCVGLNYAKHIKEAGRTPPPFPFIFFKPNTTVQDHDAPVVIPKIAQDDQADYEGELCMVIDRDAKDVSKEDALDYVAAYTAGNDISSRKLQRDPNLAGRVPQWGFSKGFDTFAPMGPCLVAAELIGDPAQLHLKTIVDGEIRQDESVSDLLFDCAYLVSYLSQGTTLQKGSVIMTGTPGGK
ncbi:AAT family amino acid transporter, partial [Aureobasidium melanogenum]